MEISKLNSNFSSFGLANSSYPLHQACKAGDLDAIRRLILLPEISLTHLDEDKTSIINIVLENDNIEALFILLDHGFPLEFVTDYYTFLWEELIKRACDTDENEVLTTQSENIQTWLINNIDKLNLAQENSYESVIEQVNSKHGINLIYKLLASGLTIKNNPADKKFIDCAILPFIMIKDLKEYNFPLIIFNIFENVIKQFMVLGSTEFISKSPIIEIINLFDPEKQVQLKLASGINEITLSLLNEFNTLVKENQKLIHFNEKFSVINKLSPIIDELEKSGFKGVKRYRENVIELEDEVFSIQNLCEQLIYKFEKTGNIVIPHHTIKLSEDKEPFTYSYFPPILLINHAISINKTDNFVHLLTKIYLGLSTNMAVNNVNAMILEKIWYSSYKSYKKPEGNPIYYCAISLKLLLESSLKNYNYKIQIIDTKNLDKFKLIQAKLLKQLDDYIPLTVLNKAGFIDKYSQHIQQSIHALKENESILIPSGCINHATCLLLTKLANGMFEMTYYNSGGGLIRWNPQWKDTNKYQTHIRITEVPAENFSHDDIWKEFSRLNFEATEMTPLYTYFLDILGKGGKRISASSFSQDFEPKQLKGTCATQNLMTWYRHQMRQEFNSQEEGLAFYKISKSFMYHKLGTTNLHNFSKKIQKHASQKIEKHSAILALAKMANDESFNESHQELLKAMNIVDPSIDTSKLYNAIDSCRPLLRFHILKSLSDTVEEMVQAYPEKLESLPDHPALVLVRAKFIDHQQLKSDVSRFLDEVYEKKDWKTLAETILRLLTSYKYKEQVNDWLAKCFCPSEDELSADGLQETFLSFNRLIQAIGAQKTATHLKTYLEEHLRMDISSQIKV